MGNAEYYPYAQMDLSGLYQNPVSPVNVYSSWSEWSPCIAPQNAPCGENGQQKRTRQLVLSGTDPTPQPTEETRACTLAPCPIDGQFSEWSDWSDCQFPVGQTCGKGQQRRTRTYAPPQFYGKDIAGPLEEIKECNKDCPKDGQFSNWSPWSECKMPQDKTCGDGQQFRSRTYEPARFGGKDLEGSLEETMNCMIECNTGLFESSQTSPDQSDTNQPNPDDKSDFAKFMEKESSGLKNWIWIFIGLVVVLILGGGLVGYLIDKKKNDEIEIKDGYFPGNPNKSN